jgi:hypothetical protein
MPEGEGANNEPFALISNGGGGGGGDGKSNRRPKGLLKGMSVFYGGGGGGGGSRGGRGKGYKPPKLIVNGDGGGDGDGDGNSTGNGTGGESTDSVDDIDSDYNRSNRRVTFNDDDDDDDEGGKGNGLNGNGNGKEDEMVAMQGGWTWKYVYYALYAMVVHCTKPPTDSIPNSTLRRRKTPLREISCPWRPCTICHCCCCRCCHSSLRSRRGIRPMLMLILSVFLFWLSWVLYSLSAIASLARSKFVMEKFVIGDVCNDTFDIVIHMSVNSKVGGATVLVTFIRVLCTLRTQAHLTIDMHLFSLHTTLQSRLPVTIKSANVVVGLAGYADTVGAIDMASPLTIRQVGSDSFLSVFFCFFCFCLLSTSSSV